MTDDLRSLVQDVRERMVRIETKLDQMADVKATADAANERAREALALAQENARNIAEIKADDRRKWGVIVGMGTTFIVSILIYFLTR
jgi:tRNA A22 N-methylase